MNHRDFYNWLKGFIDSKQGGLSAQDLELLKSRMNNVKEDRMGRPNIIVEPARPIQTDAPPKTTPDIWA
tara:strand:- start:4 stop:210 length:207 start_codon:yes stop_codon:yes gene_type:complete